VDTVTILLRDLWRLRLLVAAVAILATLAGLAVAYRLPSMESRKYEVGVATARMLVDTPKSQVIEVAPKGSEALGVRAGLLASLMVEGELKDSIAKRAGLQPDELQGVSTAGAEPGAAGDAPNTRGYVLTTSVLGATAGEQLPIIQIETQAPNAPAAAKLADAAVAALGSYLDSRAAAEQVSAGERLRVTGLGAAQARQEVRGPRLLLAVAAAILLFALGCATMLGMFALVRAWRAMSTKGHFGAGDLTYDPATVERLFAEEPAAETVTEFPRRRVSGG
jgi:hypothetical protein